MRTPYGRTPTLSKKTPRSPIFPTYLYRRGDIFYFRFRFSAEKQGNNVPPELRISLRTSYVRKASSLARRLYSELQTLLERNVDYQSIRKRLNGLLRALLEEHDRMFDASTVDIPGIGEISYEEYYLRLSKNMHQPSLKKREGLECSANQIVPELIRSGMFTENELASDEYKLLITKCYMKMMVMYGRILKARELGKYEIEEQFLKEDYIKIEKNDVLPVSKKRYLLSEAIEKYVQTKVSDGAWKEHVVIEQEVG